MFKINFSSKKEKAKHDELAKLADKMLKLNKEFQGLDDLIDEERYKEVKKEIEETDQEIDGKVYELYNLNKEKIKIIESN